MTTLTATQDGGRVRLVLTPTATLSGITRQDVNGTAAVRVPANEFPRINPLELLDAEAALTGTVTYTAGPAVARVSLVTTRPWLVSPLRPSRSLELEQVTEYGAAQGSLGTLHQVVDRRDPLAALGRLGTRSGALDIYCKDHATARARAEVLDLAGVLFLKTPDQPGMDMYFIPTGIRTRPQDGAWMLSVDYTEIGRPTSPITDAVWTLRTVSASYTSLRNISQSYDDYEGLAINDQTGVVL